jgi:hypothetical protein
MKIDDVYWHDGVLGEVRFAARDRSAGGFTFIMLASLYPTDLDSRRQLYKFTFAGSGLLSVTCDFHQLRENRGAGNIGYGYAKEQPDGKVFWLHLVDGHITFKFKSVKIEQLS